MIHRISLAALTLLIAVPLAAQAPTGLKLRLDHSTNAADPDDVPDVTVTTSADGLQVRTGPAVTAWDSRQHGDGRVHPLGDVHAPRAEQPCELLRPRLRWQPTGGFRAEAICTSWSLRTAAIWSSTVPGMKPRTTSRDVRPTRQSRAMDANGRSVNRPRGTRRKRMLPTSW